MEGGKGGEKGRRCARARASPEPRVSREFPSGGNRCARAASFVILRTTRVLISTAVRRRARGFIKRLHRRRRGHRYAPRAGRNKTAGDLYRIMLLKFDYRRRLYPRRGGGREGLRDTRIPAAVSERLLTSAPRAHFMIHRGADERSRAINDRSPAKSSSLDPSLEIPDYRHYRRRRSHLMARYLPTDYRKLAPTSAERKKEKEEKGHSANRRTRAGRGFG